MNGKKSIGVIGGDLRQIKMASYLMDAGYEIKVFGFDKDGVALAEGIVPCEDLDCAMSGMDAVILGLPASVDDETVNTPYYSKKLYIRELLRAIDKNAILLGGLISDRLQNIFKVHGVYAVDYFDREELQVKNAVPSAEGAIQIAMEETCKTIHGSRCLVLGFGRIGKILAHMLRGIGAVVTCTARKCSDMAWIECYGYDAVYTNDMADRLGEYDIIFNTIPDRVLGREALQRVSPDCLIIDLASKPGGVDFVCAKELGKKVIWALSLPGKVAPSTAGEIIKNTIINIMNELGV